MDPIFGSADALLWAEIFGDDGWTIADMSHVFAWGTAVGSHLNYTHLDVTGQGMLVGMFTGGSFSWCVQIDGGPIWRTTVFSGSVLLMAPFSSRLVVSSNGNPSNNVQAHALLGRRSQKWSQMGLAWSGATTSSHYATTVIDIVGSGVVVGLHRAFSQTAECNVCIELDDSGVRRAYRFQSGTDAVVLFLPFQTRARITSDQNVFGAVYKLD